MQLKNRTWNRHNSKGQSEESKSKRRYVRPSIHSLLWCIDLFALSICDKILTLFIGHAGHYRSSGGSGGGSDEEGNSGRGCNISLIDYFFFQFVYDTSFFFKSKSGYGRVRVKGKGKKGGKHFNFYIPFYFFSNI